MNETWDMVMVRKTGERVAEEVERVILGHEDTVGVPRMRVVTDHIKNLCGRLGIPYRVFLDDPDDVRPDHVIGGDS